MAKLTEAQITESLANVQGWNRLDDEIIRIFEFSDFVQAMGFVTMVGLLAERAHHHPDIDVRWNRVKLILTTHSEGGLTTKDFELAQAIDTL